MEALDQDLKAEITGRIEGILASVFSGERSVVRRMHDRLNFACPFCGDSETDSRKKRANIYWESMRFCCFNSGCPRSRSNVMQFLSGFGERLGSFEGVSAVSERIATARVKRTSEIGVGVFTALVEQAVPLADVERVNLLTPVEEDAFASQYLRSRMLWEFRDRFRYCEAEHSLYILNTTQGRVLGYQVRPFKPGHGSKYVSFNLERVMRDCGRKMAGTDEERMRANTLSLFFGLIQCDFSKPATVFEGAIDAMFVPNSLAITGLQKDLSYFDGGRVRFLLDNDRSGRVVAERLLRAGKPVFMWAKYIADNKLRDDVKDFNELVVLCGGLGSVPRIDGHFSDDPLDLINV